MNVANQCLTVYNDSKARINAGKGTVQDEVIVALWNHTQDQQAELIKKTHKISLLESSEHTNGFEKFEQANEVLASLKNKRYTH